MMTFCVSSRFSAVDRGWTASAVRLVERARACWVESRDCAMVGQARTNWAVVGKESVVSVICGKAFCHAPQMAGWWRVAMSVMWSPALRCGKARSGLSRVKRTRRMLSHAEMT